METRTIASNMDGVPDMQAEIIVSGNGDVRANRADNVSMHYTGTYPDGRSFDSSRDRGAPFQFRLGIGQVIRGWDLVVAEMSVGDRWSVQIPYQLAYGEAGHPAGIPAKQDLIFDMELLEVQ